MFFYSGNPTSQLQNLKRTILSSQSLLLSVYQLGLASFRSNGKDHEREIKVPSSNLSSRDVKRPKGDNIYKRCLGTPKCYINTNCYSCERRSRQLIHTHTYFMLSSPASYPAFFPTAHSLACRRNAYWLNELFQGLRPSDTELQQSNIVVKGLAVIVLMDHNPPHWGHKLGISLHIHPQVSSPRSGI